ncbi:MAG: STAS domain-containing protein [Eubacterium sp.]|nr:STAS domain-containing protein [Eubacterium sp.]
MSIRKDIISLRSQSISIRIRRTGVCKVEDQEKEVLLIEKKEEGSKLTLLLQGRLNTSTAPLLEEEFTGDKLEKASELVVDMAGLEYLSSAGLRVLLFAKKTMDGKPMTLRNASDEIVEIFDMTGFTGFFTFE